MNPLNNSNEETLLNSKPVLRKILEKTCAWGNDRQNLIASHPNFFEIEKEKKYFGNFSPYSAKEVKDYYCVPPCKNALEYAVSYNFWILILLLLTLYLGMFPTRQNLEAKRRSMACLRSHHMGCWKPMAEASPSMEWLSILLASVSRTTSAIQVTSFPTLPQKSNSATGHILPQFINCK